MMRLRLRSIGACRNGVRTVNRGAMRSPKVPLTLDAPTIMPAPPSEAGSAAFTRSQLEHSKVDSRWKFENLERFG